MLRRLFEKLNRSISHLCSQPGVYVHFTLVFRVKDLDLGFLDELMQFRAIWGE